MNLSNFANPSQLSVSLAVALLVHGCASQSLSNRLAVPSGTKPDFEEVNERKPGEQIDIKTHLAFHRFTIVDFSSQYCGSCMQIKPMLKKLTQSRRDIAVRSYDINRANFQGIDWDSPLCKQYAVHSVPAFKIFGPNMNLIAEGNDARQQVDKILSEDNSE